MNTQGSTQDFLESLVVGDTFRVASIRQAEEGICPEDAAIELFTVLDVDYADSNFVIIKEQHSASSIAIRKVDGLDKRWLTADTNAGIWSPDMIDNEKRLSFSINVVQVQEETLARASEIIEKARASEIIEKAELVRVLSNAKLDMMDIDSLRKMADIYLDGLSALSSLTDKSKRCNIHSVG